MQTHLPRGYKLRGFVFHNQKIIRVLVVFIGLGLLLTPLTVHNSYFVDEDGQWSALANWSTVIGLIIVVTAVLMVQYQRTRRR